MKKKPECKVWKSYALKKQLKIMKLSMVLIILGVVQCYAIDTYSQESKVTLKTSKMKLADLLDEIESQSGYYFLYNDNFIDVNREVSVKVEDVSVMEVLDILFNGTGIRHQIVENRIILSHMPQTKPIAQQVSTISGKVVDVQGDPIPGVNVFEKGNPMNGVITGVDGSYTIELEPKEDLVLTYSFIGFASQDLHVAGRSVINVTLIEEVTGLDEVVVTALGIKREKKALGYAMASLSSEDLTEAGETNVLNGLQGKVAGLNIGKAAGLSDATSSIVLRGNTSIAGDNNALIVVDGVLISNDVYGDGNIDRGSGINDINPDDIESVSVLKGPNASALYGSQAANGVIVITTKDKLKKSGLGVNVTTGLHFTNVSTMPNLQNVYGQGKGEVGHFQSMGDDGIPLIGGGSADETWGPKMEGQQVRINWLRHQPVVAYDPQPDNIKNLFRTGVNWNTTASVSHSSDEASYFLSMLYNKGDEFVPTATTEKTGVTIRTTQKVTDRLSVDAKLSYSKSKAHNRPENNHTSAFNMATHPRSLRLEDLRPGKYPVSGQDWGNSQWVDGAPILWTTTPNIAQYYWNLYENSNDDQRDRVLGLFSINYQITSWLNAMIRTSFDKTYFTRSEMTAPLTRAMPKGMYTKDDFNFLNQSSSFLLAANKEFNDGKLNLNGTFGGNQDYKYNKYTYFVGEDFVFEGLYTPNNTATKSYSYDEYREVINSLYGSFQVGYNHMLYLDVTGRNDWSSTLNENNNSFFYPSATGSFIFSEALHLDPSLLTFGKVRLSYAEVGNGANANIIRSYGFRTAALGDAYAYNPDRLPFYDLEPERTKAWEGGIDINAFKNRLTLDFTMYKSNTYNQIIPGQPLAYTSGYTAKSINGGNVENKGIEVTLGIQPIKTPNFKWDMNIMYAKNKSKVIDLGGMESPIVIGSMNGDNIRIAVVAGQPFGVIQGEGYLRNDEGMVVVKDKSAGSKRGIPLGNGNYDNLGKVEPDWTGAIRNKFQYKNVTLSCLIDGSFGGHIFSGINMWYDEQGTSVASLNGREEWIASENARKDAGMGSSDWDNTGGVNLWIGRSVIDNGQRDENGNQIGGVLNDGENALYSDPTKYWDAFRNDIIEANVEDATFIKVRELSLGYTLGHKVLSALPIEKLHFSVVATNPWLLKKNTEHYDPDVYRAGTGAGRQGLMEYITPPTKTIGFLVKFNF
jgi:TonB-linked SusC/RagA family outer membrane protein